MSQASRMERSGRPSQAFSRGTHMVATGMYKLLYMRPGGNCNFDPLSIIRYLVHRKLMRGPAGNSLPGNRASESQCPKPMAGRARECAAGSNLKGPGGTSKAAA